jgi:hypothetical protein
MPSTIRLVWMRADLLRRLARQAPPLPGADSGARVTRDEGHCALFDHAELLADHASLSIGVLHDNRALEHRPDVHRLSANDSVETGRYLMIQRRNDAGEGD